MTYLGRRMGKWQYTHHHYQQNESILSLNHEFLYLSLQYSHKIHLSTATDNCNDIYPVVKTSRCDVTSLTSKNDFSSGEKDHLL